MTRTSIWQWLLPVIMIVLLSWALWAIQSRLDTQEHKSISTRVIEELMYFPSGKFLKPALIEYQSAMSDLVWLRAIQYYGQHTMSDQKYEWLGHIFDILSTLDNRFVGAYHFGSFVLAWDAHQVEPAIKLLNQGMAYNPLNWQIAFDEGFVNYVQTKDYLTAGYYFEISSKLPETWKITQRWAAFCYAKGGATPMAIEIWLSIYRTTANQKLRDLAKRELINLGVKFKEP